MSLSGCRYFVRGKFIVSWGRVGERPLNFNACILSIAEAPVSQSLPCSRRHYSIYLLLQRGFLLRTEAMMTFSKGFLFSEAADIISWAVVSGQSFQPVGFTTCYSS